MNNPTGVKLVNGFTVASSIPACEFSDGDTIYYPSTQRVVYHDHYPFFLTDLDDDADPDLRTVFDRHIAFKSVDDAVMMAKAMLGIDPTVELVEPNS